MSVSNEVFDGLQCDFTRSQRDGAEHLHLIRDQAAEIADLREAVRRIAVRTRQQCVDEIFTYANDVLTPLVGAVYRDAARVLRRGEAK